MHAWPNLYCFHFYGLPCSPARPLCAKLLVHQSAMTHWIRARAKTQFIIMQVMCCCCCGGARDRCCSKITNKLENATTAQKGKRLDSQRAIVVITFLVFAFGEKLNQVDVIQIIKTLLSCAHFHSVMFANELRFDLLINHQALKPGGYTIIRWDHLCNKVSKRLRHAWR